MIGTWTAPDGTVATLMDNLSWRCSDASLRGYLRQVWNADTYSPADGEPGFAMLTQVEQQHGGKSEILTPPVDTPEGVEL